jgi:hypothetical protein
MLKLTRYQWTVLAAAWLGWGFDVFDGLLFNYVAPNAVPTLLGLTIGSPEAKAATLYWTGSLTALFIGLGGGWRALRSDLRSLRPASRIDVDDGALCARHRFVRVRYEHGATHSLSLDRESRHRW